MRSCVNLSFHEGLAPTGISHDWGCWWTEGYDVCRGCEKEKVCRHKSDAKARREGWFD
jgi:hypothetical protein